MGFWVSCMPVPLAPAGGGVDALDNDRVGLAVALGVPVGVATRVVALVVDVVVVAAVEGGAPVEGEGEVTVAVEVTVADEVTVAAVGSGPGEQAVRASVIAKVAAAEARAAPHATAYVAGVRGADMSARLSTKVRCKRFLHLSTATPAQRPSSATPAQQPQSRRVAQ